MSGQLNYSERYAILSARVAYAEYAQRQKLANEGRIVSLNIFPPNHDASIMTRIRIGQVNTTAEELTNYLSAVDLPATGTIPDVPIISVIPSDNALTIIVIPGYDGGSPITNYSYSTDGVNFTPLMPDDSSGIFTITGLENGLENTINVRAINSFGSSPMSDAVTASPIPSSFDPSNISGLNLWLDAQNTNNVILTSTQVSAWNDSSSGANNFTAVGGSITYSKSSDINKRPAINFVDSAPTRSTYLHKTGFNITGGTNTFTLFIVLMQTVIDVTGNSELFATRPYQPFDLFNNTNTTGNLSLNARSITQRDTGQKIIDSPPVVAIITVVLSSTTGTIYLNGSKTSVDNTSFTGAYSINAALDWAISGGAFKGYVGEVITYPSILANLNREKVEAYLGWKWGLQAQLYDYNNWKSYPPTDLTPWLLYDANNLESYPGTGTAINNIGIYGGNTGLIELSVPLITSTDISRNVFNFIAGGYFTFSTTNAINFTSNFTITAWIKPSTNAGINAILANGLPGNTAGFKFGWNGTSKSLIFESGGTGGAGWTSVSSAPNLITPDSWQHLAVVFNQSTNSAVFYIYGNAVTMVSSTTATNVIVSGLFHIGTYVGGTNRMAGKLACLNVYNSSLTARQVHEDYARLSNSF